MPNAISFVTAILLAHHQWPWHLGAAACACGIAALIAATRRWVWLAFYLAGFGWTLAYDLHRVADALAPTAEGVDCWVEGRIRGLPKIDPYGLRFEIDVDDSARPGEIPRRIRVSWHRADLAQVPRAGERWHLTVRLKQPHGFANPGGFDYELWLFAHGIRATGYVRDAPDNHRLEAALPYTLAFWRQTIVDRLDAALRWSEFAGIVKALVVGVEDDISSPQWDVLRRTGTAHLVAISGSHIALMAGLAYALARRLSAHLHLRRFPPPALAGVSAVLAAFVYAGLADFAIPTQRALIMVAVVMGRIILQRPANSLNTLAVALIAVTAYDPLAATAPGFWLSFGAVGVIVLMLDSRLRPLGFWAGLWRLNWVTAVGLAPLLLLFFQQVSLVSPFANLLAVPLLGLVAIPAALIGTALLPIPPVGDLLLGAAEQIVAWTWQLLVPLAALPSAQWQHPPPTLPAMALAVGGVLLLIAPRGIPGRALGAVLLLPALTNHSDPPAPAAFTLTLLDVGQGLSAVVRTAEHVLVFDAGARLGDDFDLGKLVVEPFLRAEGLERIDALVVSHGDNDHIGGAPALLQAFQTDRVLTSVPTQLPDHPQVSACTAGQEWNWDGIRFRMLGPLRPMERDNDNSCVLQIGAGTASVLLTGDIEKPAEALLAEHFGSALGSHVLVAPHHGSKTSSTPALLDQVKPGVVLIPAGYRNRYGFPHSSVIARYQAAGASILNTADSGAIRVDCAEPTGCSTPIRFRDTQRGFWHAADSAGL